MAPEPVSFRITRTAEDLAQTVSALSHRLVKLEQRLGALELSLEHREDNDPADLAALANVEVLLRDCRLLLDDAPDTAAPALSLPEPDSAPLPLSLASDHDEEFRPAA